MSAARLARARDGSMTLISAYMMGLGLTATRESTTPAVFADRAWKMYGINLAEAERVVAVFAELAPLVEELGPIVAKADRRMGLGRGQ